MKTYKVKDTLKGDLMLGETKVRPGMTVVDNGTNPMLSRAIANCLKMSNPPLSVTGEAAKPVAKPAPAAKDKEQPSQKGGK